MKIILTVGVMALILGSHIVIADSEAVEAPPSQIQMVILAAEMYAAPLHELMNVGHCESGHDADFFDQSAIGSAGEIGGFQYFKSTWKDMTKAMGQKMDINSFEDQAKVTAWVFANHPEWKKQWSTWRVWYGEGKHVCRIVKT